MISGWTAFGLLFFAIAVGGGGTYLIARWMGIWPGQLPR